MVVGCLVSLFLMKCTGWTISVLEQLAQVIVRHRWLDQVNIIVKLVMQSDIKNNCLLLYMKHYSESCA